MKSVSLSKLLQTCCLLEYKLNSCCTSKLISAHPHEATDFISPWHWHDLATDRATDRPQPPQHLTSLSHSTEMESAGWGLPPADHTGYGWDPSPHPLLLLTSMQMQLYWPSLRWAPVGIEDWQLFKLWRVSPGHVTGFCCLLALYVQVGSRSVNSLCRWGIQHRLWPVLLLNLTETHV